MKTTLSAMLLATSMLAGSGAAFADNPEPTVYVIQKGDTLWGLSDRFIKDPHYWPNMWANNPVIGNPHFIFPGQKVWVYKDRLSMEPPAPAAPAAPAALPAAAPAPAPPPVQTEVPEVEAPQEAVVQERLFPVQTGAGAGFLLEKDAKPAGMIISTYQNRQMIGEDDVAYRDIGQQLGAKAGDRFFIYQDMGVVQHPVLNVVLGHKMVPLGVLQLSEIEGKTSRAIVTESYLEIGAGALLQPYRDKRREVALKAATREMNGYIVDTQTGNRTVAAGDVVFLDLGSLQGLEAGNMLYVCRDVEIDKKYLSRFDKVPEEVLGAVVVVETGEKTSTAVVVKGVDAIYIGDRVALKKAK